jgi:hypothetical protein
MGKGQRGEAIAARAGEGTATSISGTLSGSMTFSLGMEALP